MGRGEPDLEKMAKQEFSLKRNPKFYATMKSIVKPLLKSYYSISCEGADLIPYSGPVFLSMKHIGIFDILAVGVSVDRQVNTLHKTELSKNPYQHKLFEKMGGIRLDRDSSLSPVSREAVKYSKWLLGQGEVIALFPEMTRVLGAVGKLHIDLITHYYRRVEPVPVYTVGIWYDRKLEWNNPGTKVEVRIEQADMSGGSLEEIADTMGRQMARLSKVEYHPELSPKYLDKSGAMG